MCKEGKKSADQPLLDRLPVRGVMVDFLETTINRFLYGLGFTPQVTLSTFYARLKHHENQRSWLATLIAEGKPEWLTNPNERIFKASLTQEAKFWWGVVCTHLIPIEGDNILGDDRAILVASLMDKLKLCKAAHVPEVVGLDEELLAKKAHNPIQYDENQSRLTFDRGAGVETGPPVTGTSSTPNVAVKDSKAATPTFLVIEDSMPKNEKNPSAAVSTTEFAFNPMNFRRVEK
ncbi:hypothetical protein CQW23_23951 [Capsicum baccatum]|uniref:Putative plant transposon protein domain-containing protein n=1 Tax=Capsicum baccatum TaxID=33114 RepID=A0A2G2VTF4_CAPBA|nr:hypothetical protein CQW23_23951 [Capsicum baccatum]